MKKQRPAGSRRRTAMPPAREPSLLAYRQLCRRAATAQERLAEYCTAIEDFGLEEPGACAPGAAPVRCREGLLEPADILTRAERAACAVEELTGAAQTERGRQLTRLLRRSGDLAEYRALCRLYVEPADELWPAAAGERPTLPVS